MEERLHTCCFTGHRAIAPRHREQLSLLLRRQLRLLIRDGISTFAAGGALGFDTLGAETVLAMQPEFPHLRLLIVAPCADQNARWSASDFARYERIREAADDYICLSAAYHPGCMSRRNHYLVDISSVCLGYLLHAPSGTAQTMLYAQKQGLEVLNLASGLIPPVLPDEGFRSPWEFPPDSRL